MRCVITIGLAAALAGCAAAPTFDCPQAPGLTTGIVAVLPAFSVHGAPPTADFTSTAERVLAERGYRVVPARAVAERLWAAGLGPESDMHHAPLNAVRAACAADAVLYIHVDFIRLAEWSNASVTRIRYTVRDARNGNVVWRNDVESEAMPPIAAEGLLFLPVGAGMKGSVRLFELLEWAYERSPIPELLGLPRNRPPRPE